MMQPTFAEELVAQRRAHDLATAAAYRPARPAAERHHFHLMSVAAAWSRLAGPQPMKAAADGAACIACA